MRKNKIKEDNKKKEDLHSAFECEEIGMLKVPEYKLEDVVLKESVKDKVMFFLSSLKEPAMESFGIGQTIKNGKGLNILFYGPPGTGTDVAIESAGITLVKGDINGIAKALVLSKAVMHNIKQNLFFAFVYNLIGIPIAAGALYPAFGILLSPMIAGAAMSFSSVSVIGNALRLRKQ